MNGLALSAVRRSIGLVQQDPFIFVGTLAENLRLGRDGIEDGRLWQALEEVQLADFVRRLPDGLATLMEEGQEPLRWPAPAALLARAQVGIRASSSWTRRPRAWTPRPSSPLPGALGGTPWPHHHRHRPPSLHHCGCR